MITDMPLPTVPRAPPRWFAFSLRTLLVAVAVLAVGLTCVLHSARVQRDAVAALRSVGATVEYDYELDAKGQASTKRSPEGPPWITDLFGLDFSNTAIGVWFYGGDATLSDETLTQLGRLTELRRVALVDAGLKDNSLRQLSGLKQLEMLSLQQNSITDEGLKYLAELPALTALDLSGTRITDAGIQNLLPLKRLTQLNLRNVQITDAGLESFSAFPNLSTLDVQQTRVRPETLHRLQLALPNLKIRYDYDQLPRTSRIKP